MPRAKKLGAEKPKRATKATKTEKEEGFSLVVHVNDEVFKTKADSLAEALREFVDSPVRPIAAKTTLVLHYSKGKVERQRNYFAHQANRFLNKISEIPSQLEFIAEKMTQELNG